MKLNVNNWSLKLFYLFLATDIVFIILHLAYIYTGRISNISFSIAHDGGYAELFQYLKEYWIAILLCFVAVRKRSVLYLTWSLLFFYLLLDDSINIHERLGAKIANKLSFSTGFELRAQDFGEVIVSAAVGLLFLSLITIAYRFSERQSRKVSRYLIMMLFTLAFFGIAVDLAHVAFRSSSLQIFFGILEDGGEQVVMSIIACFIFLLPERLQSENNNLKILQMTLPEKVLSKKF